MSIQHIARLRQLPYAVECCIRPLRSPLLSVMLLAGLLLAPAAARAQFTGPTPKTNSTLNVPLPPTTNPAILYPAAREVTLSNGDLISVKVAGAGDYVAAVRIGADGRTVLPLIGSIELGGLTISASQTKIAEALVQAQMFVDPQVLVQLTEGANAAISVVGELHGVIPAIGSRRLFDVLAAAGSLPPTASHVITIDRPGVAQPIVVDLGTDPVRSKLANVPVFPGDTIIVSRVGIVYVMGAFKSSGAIPLSGNTPLTLLQVAALSGGAEFQGKMGDLRIIRTTGNSRSLVKVNYAKVLAGQAPDPIMQNDDIVYLPTSAYKAVLVNGTLGQVLGVVSLLLSLATYTR